MIRSLMSKPFNYNKIESPLNYINLYIDKAYYFLLIDFKQIKM